MSFVYLASINVAYGASMPVGAYSQLDYAKAWFVSTFGLCNFNTVNAHTKVTWQKNGAEIGTITEHVVDQLVPPDIADKNGKS